MCLLLFGSCARWHYHRRDCNFCFCVFLDDSMSMSIRSKEGFAQHLAFADYFLWANVTCKTTINYPAIKHISPISDLYFLFFVIFRNHFCHAPCTSDATHYRFRLCSWLKMVRSSPFALVPVGLPLLLLRLTRPVSASWRSFPK